MAVKALKHYQFPAADTQDKFHGNQLVYVGWDKHLFFCAPFAFCLPPNTRFGDLCDKVLPQAFSAHPEWSQVDLSKAVWKKSGQPWQPDMNKTLAELGIGHKEALRFETPGLNGIQGSCS
ncbi:MAG TPA: phenol hydroxylase subunit P4 [Rhodocyclaceae bacterium]|nr:phenol hydroxylase subunit P4 [Rhodocyclaceae bacterium]